jgi:4-phosphopantoate--beta-alanine ligase
VEAKGIFEADLVLLGIEDGDRVEALRKAGKKVIVIDLNPLSRSAFKASITIIDNVVRALPKLRLEIEKLRSASKQRLRREAASYDNRKTLAEALNYIRGRLEKLASNLASGRS